MDLTQIRYFLEVAKNQHVTRSAQRLHVAQPALTQSIHRLERELEVPLFLPQGRGIALTEYGKYLQSRLEPIVRELDSLPDQMRTMAALTRDIIHINVLAASSLVTEAIIQYRGTHDQINFQLLQSAENELYDISISTRLSGQPAGGGDEYVQAERIFLAVPNNEKYRGMKTICLSDAREEGFISLLGSRQMRWICDKFCQQAGFQPRVIFESDSPAAVRNMIAANMGVGFWPECSWGPSEGDHVLLLEIEEPVCRRDLLITLKRNKANNQSVEEFYRFLTSYFEKATWHA